MFYPFTPWNFQNPKPEFPIQNPSLVLICMNTKTSLLMDFFLTYKHILLRLESLFSLPFYLLFLWAKRVQIRKVVFFLHYLVLTQVPPHDFLFSSSLVRLPFGAIMLKNLYFGCNTSVLIDSTRRIAVLNSRGKGLLSVVAAAHYVPTNSQHLKALIKKW